MSVVAFFVVCFIGYTLILFFTTPSNDRDWSPDQEIMAGISIERGDQISIKHIRNFTYQTTSDYTPGYLDKTFNLSEVHTLWYVVEPLGDYGIAHTFLSFGLADGSYIAISVEARKERDERFSPWKGMFNTYELMYVIADERDVVKLRTNFRKDTVYVYPVIMKPEIVQQIFKDMLMRAKETQNAPEFYNSVTNTCMVNIIDHINKVTGMNIGWGPKILLPARSDEVLYDAGLLDTSVSIEELRSRHKINERARIHADDPDFSRRIREVE